MFSNKLTPAQVERLAFLSEELGEAIQAIGKILRHGYKSSHPDIPERCNREDLERELGHIHLAISMLVEANDLVSYGNIATYATDKRLEITQYLHHQF